MHTDETTVLLDEATSALGKSLRVFSKQVCPAFETYETPKEFAARQKRAAKKAGPAGATAAAGDQRGQRRQSTYKLNRIKLHLLGDYAAHIPMYGTTDSYTTRIVSVLC